MSNQWPAVFVHGILGFGPTELGGWKYWGSAFLVPSELERYQAVVGPISSAHDRACELAAQIKGTRVDYGADHALAAGHERFGRDYTGQGFLPDWSAGKPVHLVGHSLGSPTMRCLQDLLERDVWGWGSDHRWIYSISTISGVSNGTTATYFFGADEKTGLLHEDTLATDLLRIFDVFMYATHAQHVEKGAIYDFMLDQWGFERQDGEPLDAYLARVAQSDFMKGTDNACYTLTPQGAYADNARWRTYPDTYYFSHVTEQTFASLGGRYLPSPLMDTALLPVAFDMGRKEFAEPPAPGLRAADWWENDGLVSTYSQMYPRISGDHPVGDEFNKDTPAAHFRPGQWYYEWERDVDHLDVCILPQPNQVEWQKEFYTRLLHRLANL